MEEWLRGSKVEEAKQWLMETGDYYYYWIYWAKDYPKSLPAEHREECRLLFLGMEDEGKRMFLRAAQRFNEWDIATITERSEISIGLYGFCNKLDKQTYKSILTIFERAGFSGNIAQYEPYSAHRLILKKSNTPR